MGAKDKATISLNSTFVRPAKFYINGFSNVPHAKYYYVFLSFVYILTVVGNVALLSVIFLAKSLHTPKYMTVFNLGLTDLCGSTALIPKLLDTFLFNRRYIVYETCLSYMFFVLFFGCLQSWTLVIMAYDRFIAICVPLKYHNFVTTTSIAAMLLLMWVSFLSYVAFTVSLINRLSFCKSVVIESFYCDHGPILPLACNDVSLNKFMAYMAFILVMCIPAILIVVTYVCIVATLSRIASGKERLKALKTCTSHLALVVIFFIPLIGTNIAAVTSDLHPNVRIINSTLTHTIPALLNPIVYSLKTEEVFIAFNKLWTKKRQSNTAVKKN